MRKSLLVLLICQLLLWRVTAQSTFPTNGAPFNPHTLYAFINANIYSDYETLIKNGVLLIQDARVVNVGEKVEIPKHAVVFDLKGRYIYPSFIDLYSDYGVPSNKFQKKEPGPQMESNYKGAFGWNQAIRSNVESYKLFIHAADKAEELKKIGFATVLTCPKDGIVRGSGALVNLNSTARENESVVLDKAAGFYSFSKGSSPQDYPSSLTGGIALCAKPIWMLPGTRKIKIKRNTTLLWMSLTSYKRSRLFLRQMISLTIYARLKLERSLM